MRCRFGKTTEGRRAMANKRTSKKRASNWRENALLWGLGIASYLIGFPLALYLHENAPE